MNLEDLYTGKVKKVRITKKIMDSSGMSTSVAIEKEIQIKPGWLSVIILNNEYIMYISFNYYELCSGKTAQK